MKELLTVAFAAPFLSIILQSGITAPKAEPADEIPRRNKMTFDILRVALLLPMIWICATVGAPARAQTSGPWIGANYIFIAPTTAQIVGEGFQPGEPLWLDVTDPGGAVSTTPIFADEEGRILVDLFVDQPGIHRCEIRNGVGQILTEGEVFVGVD